MFERLSLFIISLVFISCLGLFTDDFSRFIEDNYGENFLDLLQRKDLGDKGSFGGKSSSNEEIQQDPVIFVHGVSDTAGEKMKQIADKFVEIGYVEGELYSTTYSHGARGNPISWTQYSMRCEYVKQIRALILAVRYYTGKDVDIVAYSLGVPIARKAILGGFCVDTDEELGTPLTKYVDTFVGIAGPNHGIALKVIGLPIPACVLGTPPICDRMIGLYSGLCPLESMFLNDINKKEHYEARNVYSIYSQSDHLVGYRVCDKITASIPGEDGHKVFPNLDHDDVLPNSVDTVFNLLQNHSTFLQFKRPPVARRSFRVNQRKPREKEITSSTTSLPLNVTLPTSPPTTSQSPQSESDIARSLEAIFTDTKESALQNIRNFFRQKFADEKENEITARHETVQARQQRPEDNLDEHNKPKVGEKNASGTDAITRPGLAEKSSGESNEKVPFMRSTQSHEGNGYHTRIRLQLDGK